MAQLGRAPMIESDAVCLVVGSIPGCDLCERNTFGGVQQRYGLRELVSSSIGAHNNAGERITPDSELRTTVV